MFFTDLGSPKSYEYKLLLVYFLATGLSTSFLLGLPFVLVDPEFICYTTDETGQIVSKFSCTHEEACVKNYQFQLDIVNSISSIVLEYDLICDRRYLADLIGSFTFFGQFIGFVLYTAHYHNQKNAFDIAIRTIFHCGFWALISMLSQGPFTYMIFRFIFSIFLGGLNIIAYSHIVELTSYNPVFMNFCVIFINISWGVGQIYVGTLCSIDFSWRWSLPIYNGVPLILLSFYFWKLKERQEEYENVRERELAMVKTHHKKQVTFTLNTFTKVLSYKSIRKKLIISTILFLFINLSYFGTIFSISSLGESKGIYTNLIMMALFEVCSYIISGYISPYCRRKLALLLIFFINVCLFFFFLWVGVEDASHLSATKEFFIIFLALIGRFFICSAYMFFYVYYAELIPKSVIRTTFGFANSILALGLIYMPWMITQFKIHGMCPFFAFSIINLVGFICMLFVSETKGNEVQEITEEEKMADKSTPLIDMTKITK